MRARVSSLRYSWSLGRGQSVRERKEKFGNDEMCQFRCFFNRVHSTFFAPLSFLQLFLSMRYPDRFLLVTNSRCFSLASGQHLSLPVAPSSSLSHPMPFSLWSSSIKSFDDIELRSACSWGKGEEEKVLQGEKAEEFGSKEIRGEV